MYISLFHTYLSFSIALECKKELIYSDLFDYIKFRTIFGFEGQNF